MLERMRQAGGAMRASGLHDAFYQGCDEEVRSVSGQAQGHLFRTLLEASGYVDPSSVDLLRHGASVFCLYLCTCACVLLSCTGQPMLEELECSGIGTRLQATGTVIPPVKALWHDRAASNRALVQELAEDPHAESLLEVTRKEAAIGRMTVPRVYVPCECDDVLLHPRFGVEQEREDGSMKVRPVDNFSWSRHSKRKQVAKTSSVNGHVSPSEKLKHDTLDVFAQAMIQFMALVGCLPGLLKVGVFSSAVFVFVRMHFLLHRPT